MSISEELQRQNDRLQFVMNLNEQNHVEPHTPRGLTRDCTNIRQVIHADAVTVALPDSASEN